jgi:hypothetical protein
VAAIPFEAAPASLPVPHRPARANAGLARNPQMLQKAQSAR